MREVWQGFFWDHPTSSLSSPCCVQLPMENPINGPCASLVQEDPLSWFPAGIEGAVRSRVAIVCPVFFPPNSFAFWPAFIQKALGFVWDYLTSMKLMV